VSGSTETETNISSLLGKEISKVDLQVVNKLAKKGSSYIMLEYMNKYFEGDIMDTSCWNSEDLISENTIERSNVRKICERV
jgi:hypothetical protein